MACVGRNSSQIPVTQLHLSSRRVHELNRSSYCPNFIFIHLAFTFMVKFSWATPLAGLLNLSVSVWEVVFLHIILIYSLLKFFTLLSLTSLHTYRSESYCSIFHYYVFVHVTKLVYPSSTKLLQIKLINSSITSVVEGTLITFTNKD